MSFHLPFPTGLESLLESAALPLPRGEKPSGTAPAVLVGTSRPHPADLVQVVLRRDGGPLRVVRAIRDLGMGGPQQWYRALLPELAPGSYDEYRVELIRAGQRLAGFPTDGSWIGLRGASAPAAEPPPPVPPPAPGTRFPQPRFAYEMEFFAALSVTVRAEPLGPTPEGYRANFFVEGGRVAGPRIDAEILPGGGDWMLVRRDGIGRAHVRMTWQTTDGALILDQGGGTVDLGPHGYSKVVSGDYTGTAPYCATKNWSASAPNWKWLNRRQGLGVGIVFLDRMLVEVDLYLPRVADRYSRV